MAGGRHRRGWSQHAPPKRGGLIGFVSIAAILLAIAAPPEARALPGEVLSEQKISSLSGGFGGALLDSDQLGISTAGIGDLNQDGVNDLAVGAWGDDDGGGGRGAVWILFMNANGTVSSEQKISQTAGGFGGLLSNTASFGGSLASLGDLDGDGVGDLAVGAHGDDTDGANRGAAWILFMNANGTVKSEQRLGHLSHNGIILDDGDTFGFGLSTLGDLDGDGLPELAVGAYNDDDGASAAGAVYVLFLQPDGTVHDSQKISSLAGGFSGSLDAGDRFGIQTAGLGDLDGDGVYDLAVTADLDDDGGTNRGAVWILFLNEDGTVKSQQKISDLAGNFSGALDDSDLLGRDLGAVGDVNGDGIADLAVGAYGDDDGGTERGAVWILFLDTDGTVNSHQKISDTTGNFGGTLDDVDRFGVGVSGLGDLGGDGIGDLAVGAYLDDDGGPSRGAVWILNLDGSLLTCGNAVLDPIETCDDGNTVPNDGCSATCQTEFHDLQIDRFEVVSASHPVHYVVGADSVTADLELEISLDDDEVAQPVEVRFELVAYTRFGVSCDSAPLPLECTAAGTGGVFQFPVEVVSVDHIDSRPSYPGAPLGPYATRLQLSGALNQDGSSQTFEAWRAAHAQQGNHYRFRARIDPDNLIPEYPVLAEANNTANLSTIYHSLPISGSLFFGPQETQIVSVTLAAPGICSPGEVSIVTVVFDWQPSTNGNWDTVQITRAPMGGQGCSPLNLAGGGPGFDLIADFNAPAPVHNGTHGGIEVEYTGTILQPGPAGGAYAGTATVTLPEGHSLHAIEAGSGLPSPRGVRTVEFVSPGGPISDFGLMLLSPPPNLLPGYLHVVGMPVSIRYSSFALVQANAAGAVGTARYVHDLPYHLTDARNSANKGVRSNDRRFQAYDGSGPTNIMRLDGSGVDVNLAFLRSAPSMSAPTHFPRTEMTWGKFTLPLVDGQVVPGAIYTSLDTYAFRQSAGCVDCPADTAAGPEFLVNPTLAQGVAADGATFARTPSLGSADPAWGPYDSSTSGFIFERPGEAAEPGILLMPGFRIPGSGGDAGASGAPASVAGSLMGMRRASDVGGTLVPGAVYRLGSTEANRGNHFMAGVTVGPELYRGPSFGQPSAGVGTLLGGNILSVGFGGLPNPVYESIVTNDGVKYVLREGGLTGVFNTLTAPNPAIYGYSISLDRFAFRQVSNNLDPNTWIDGNVYVGGPADFTIVFESLDLLCTGNIGEGLIVRESCDGSDSNQNGVPDENCDERLLAWKTHFELLSMEFVPPAGSAVCDPGDRLLEVGSVVDVVALEHEIGLMSKWDPVGMPSDSRISGKTEHLFDDPGMPGAEAFLMTVGSAVDLVVHDNMTNGWFRFHDASIGLPFWDAVSVGARMQNVSETTQMLTAIGHEVEDASFLDDIMIDTGEAAGLMGGSEKLKATYTWGATGFSISLPVSYGIPLLGETRRFVGHREDASLLVMEASAGTDFITPSETKISFGASANFNELNFSSLPLNIDLSDPAAMLQLDNFLGGSFISDIAGNLAGSVNGMNGIVGNNLDGFIEDGIFGAIGEEVSAQGGTAFEDLATPLAQVQSIPGQLVEQVALELDDLTAGLLDPLTLIASTRLQLLLTVAPTFLFDARQGNPNVAGIEQLIDEVDRVLETLDAVADNMGGLENEIFQARDNIRGVGNNLLTSIQGATSDAQSAANGILGLVDDAVGLGVCNADNPVIEQIREVGDAVRDVQNVLEAIDLQSIGDAMSSVAEVDLSTVAQAETEIQNLAKDIADGINQAIGAVEGAVGCGGGSLPYGSFGDDLEAFNADLQAALGTLGSDLPAALDTLIGQAAVPGDLGKLGLVADTLDQAQSSVAIYRGRLEGMRGALDSALSATPAYEFPSASVVEISNWFNAVLTQGPTNAIDLLKNTLTLGVDLAIDQAAFHATTGLAVNMSDLAHPTGADVENLVTDLLMNDGLIEQADATASFHLTSLVDKSNGIQLLVFDQINHLVRNVIASQDGVLAGLLANETSTVSGSGNDWNMPSAGLDGWALIAGDDLQQMHVGFKLSVPGQEDSDSFNLDVALDVTRWTANGKDIGCATVDAASRLDVIISAYNLPFRLGTSEANIRKVYFGFTLQENAGSVYPVQGFGGLAIDGALDFQVVKVLDPAFVFGAGDVEVYIGASASATFDTTSISVAFLIGKICNNEPLLVIDPQAGEFIDFPDSPGQGFAGGYVRGSASTVIISYGCPLEIGAGVDVGNWVFVGPPVVAGGIMGGGIFGKAACIVSIRGQLTLLIGISDAIASFGGEMFIAGGLGICSPSGWTTVPKSRNDDIFCATIDATIGSSATVDLEALFDGAGSGAIDFKVEEPEFGAIH